MLYPTLLTKFLDSSDPGLYAQHLLGYIEAYPSSVKHVNNILLSRSKEFRALNSKKTLVESSLGLLPPRGAS